MCKNCYPEFYERLVERTIKKYRLIKKGERIGVAISGGKDSAALGKVLTTLSMKIGFELETFFIDLGIEEYSRKSLAVVKKIDPDVNVVNLKNITGSALVKMSKGKKICSACGTIKRYLMNKTAREMRVDKLATGHCADDIAVFFFKNWLAGNFEWSEKLLPLTESFDPRILPRIRPLYERTEKENAYYVLTTCTPFLVDECPLAPEDEWKEILYGIERKKPGFKQSFVRGIVGFYKRSEKRETYEGRSCSICGELTTGEICSFCRIVKRSFTDCHH